MKILHIVAGMDPKMGGVCQAVRSIVTGFHEKEIDSEVVSLDEPGSSFLSDSRFIIHALGRKPGAWMYSPDLIPWLVNNLSRFNTVIVHGMWHYHAYAINRAITILRKLNTFPGIPSVYIMPHGMLDPYFQRASQRKLKAFRNWAYWKLIERHVINNADALLFTSEEERRLAAEPFRPYRPKKQIVTGLGVEDPPPYTSAMKQSFLERCPSSARKPYLLFLGRIDEKKGVELLIKTFSKIVHLTDDHTNLSSDERNRLPALVIAGPGVDTPYGRSMQQLVRRLSLNNHIFFPGMLIGDAKWGAFYGCDAFVLPSHQENFGIAVVEALACNKPVLITNRVNIWREIDIGKAGIITEDTFEGVESLIQQWLCIQHEERKAIGERAGKVYTEYFSAVRASERFYKALQP